MSCKKSSSLNHGQIHFWRDSWGFPRSELFLCKSGSLTTLINHFQSILFLNFTALESIWPTQWTVCNRYVNKSCIFSLTMWEGKKKIQFFNPEYTSYFNPNDIFPNETCQSKIWRIVCCTDVTECSISFCFKLIN